MGNMAVGVMDPCKVRVWAIHECVMDVHVLNVWESVHCVSLCAM